MTTRLEADGNVIDYVAGSAISSGDVVVTGDIVGIALTDIANGATGAVGIEGVFNVVKSSGVAWVQGDTIDYDGAAGDFDKDKAVPVAGDVEDCCVAYVAAASGALVGQVKLTPGTGTAA